MKHVLWHNIAGAGEVQTAKHPVNYLLLNPSNENYSISDDNPWSLYAETQNKVIDIYITLT